METTAQDLRLEIRRTYDATPAELFAAWTDPEALGTWFAPTAEMTTIVHALDLREGGAYRIEMRPPAGETHIVTGTYHEVRAPNRLSFTWRWENKPQDGETLVTLEFIGAPQGSELLLRHTRFTSEGSRDGHGQGWDGCLARLGEALRTG
ncbi:MAG: SRPBCC family protein [Gemmatimonadaceae bacterium]